MKKFFLIPLMTLVCSVMAWGTEIVVNDFASLKNALSAEGTADVVKLGQDITYTANGSTDYLLNIERSLTLDGQGHKIIGWGKCNANHDEGKTYYILTPLAINFGEAASNLDVTVKNISMSTLANTKSSSHEIGLMVFDKVSKCPSNWRKGQSVFNVVDEYYGVARMVQFIDRVDCFYDNSKIDEFLSKAYNRLIEISNEQTAIR